MKHFIQLSLFIAFVLLTATSCEEINTQTVIRPDGSCRREYLITNEVSQPKQAGQAERRYASMMHDSGWQRSISPEQIRLWREYPNVEAMSADHPIDLGGKPLTCHSTLRSRFHWFYTEHTYTETYACVSHYFKIPTDDYMSHEEAVCWFTSNDTLCAGKVGSERLTALEAIEEKAYKWLSANEVRAHLDMIADNYDSVPNPPLSRDAFVAGIDSMTRRIMQEGYSIKIEKPGTSRVIGRFLTHVYGSDAYTDTFFSGTAEECKDNDLLERQLATQMEVLTTTFNGRLDLMGNDYTYSFRLSSLIADDVVCSWTIRRPNIWAYAVSALIVLMAIGLTIYCHKKQTK